MLRNLVLASICLSCACTPSRAQQPSAILRLEREIPLTGVEGRIDHLSADVAGKRVFIAALGNGTVEVVDMAQGKRTGQIKGLKEPQGVAYAPSNGALYVAGGGDGTVRSFDSHTLAPLHGIALGPDADNLRLDAAHGQLLAGYGAGGVAVLGLDLARRANLALPVHPESFQLSADGKQVFVNLPDNRSIASIDLAAQTVNAAWSHPSASANFSMALDETQHRLFIPCRKPARLLVLNALTGALASWGPTIGDADDVFFDPVRSFVYVIGGEGFVDVVQVRAANSLVSRARVPTAPGARTGLFVPEWNELLVAVPHQGANEPRLLVFSLEK